MLTRLDLKRVYNATLIVEYLFSEEAHIQTHQFVEYQAEEHRTSSAARDGQRPYRTRRTRLP